MTFAHEEIPSGPATPRDVDWKPDSDPTYEDKTSEGGEWYGKTDHDIVLIQIEEFNWEKHEQYHQELDEHERDDE